MSLSAKKRVHDSERTRQRILEAAVKQFGTYGFRGASMRSIVNDAEVNLASVNYHFKSKMNLYFTVIDSYFSKVARNRAHLLRLAADLPHGEERVRGLIRAYISPHIDLVVGEGEHDYGRLILNVLTDDEEIADRFCKRQLDDTRLPFLKQLGAAFCEAEEDQLFRAFGFLVSIMITAPFDGSYRSLTGTPALRCDADKLTTYVTNFAYGGLTSILEMDPK